MHSIKFLSRCANVLPKFHTNASSRQWWPKIACNFTTSTQLAAKQFADKENSYAHNILVNSNLKFRLCLEPEVTGLVGTESDRALNHALDIEGKTLTNEDLVARFKVISTYCKTTETCISDDRFDSFVDRLTDVLHTLSDDQLLDVLRYFNLVPETRTVHIKNFAEMWAALDTVCMARIDKWDVDTLLHYCDGWYALNLARPSEFVWNSLRKIGRRIKRLSPQQLIHSMFICNVIRKPLMEMYEFELNFIKVIGNMTLDEISVMSMGFFKTQTPLRDPALVELIYRRLITEVETVKDITLVNILKILRYSSKIPHAGIMDELLDKLCSQIDRISLLSCLHVSLMGCDIQHCHVRSIQLLVERFNRDIDSARIKDMERICHVIALYNFKSESGVEQELCQKIIEKIKSKAKEVVRYPRCFPNCLHYLSILGYHDEELISSCLDPKFIKHTYGRNMLLGREIFCLDSFAKINLKETYKGNSLQDRQRRTMGKCLTRYVPERGSKYKLHNTDRIMLEIKEATEDLYKICTFKHILPHFERPDLILCYNRKERKFIPLGEDCPVDYMGTILTRDLMFGQDVHLDDIATISIITGGWNNFVRHKNIPTGLMNLKIQQLKILGHIPVVVPWYEWKELQGTLERHEYMRRKIDRLL